MGASSSSTNGRKIAHMKRVATQRGLPLVFLGESSGARMPDHMGARGMGSLLGNDPTQYVRLRETPWASATLGLSYGSSSWYAVLSDFCVIRKGAVLAVSSSLLASLATGEQVDPQELGGWRLHAETTGFADVVAETDEEALAAIRTFLSYLPSHANQAPPEHPVTAGSGDGMRDIARLLPAKRTQVYDVRRIIRAIVDKDSLFELKARFGKVAVTALSRIGGRTVGIVANNPLVKGGALDTDACEKITSFLVLCDSFNIPLVMFVDTPGFAIGTEAERKRAPGKIMNFMHALQMFSMPKISVILRKSYGQAYLNMGGGRNSDEVAAWPTAEVSFMDPTFAVRVVHGLSPGEPGFDDAFAQMSKDSEPWDIAGIYAVQSIIEPHATRDYLIRMLDVHRLRMTRRRRAASHARLADKHLTASNEQDEEYRNGEIRGQDRGHRCRSADRDQGRRPHRGRRSGDVHRVDEDADPGARRGDGDAASDPGRQGRRGRRGPSRGRPGDLGGDRKRVERA